jgi:hypothetical protein
MSVVQFIELCIAHIRDVLHLVGDLVLLSDEFVDLEVAGHFVMGQLLRQFNFLRMEAQVVSISAEVSQVIILQLTNSIGPRVEGDIRQAAMFVPANGAAVAVASVALILETAESLATAVADAAHAGAEARAVTPVATREAPDDQNYEENGKCDYTGQHKSSLPVARYLVGRSNFQGFAPYFFEDVGLILALLLGHVPCSCFEYRRLIILLPQLSGSNLP